MSSLVAALATSADVDKTSGLQAGFSRLVNPVHKGPDGKAGATSSGPDGDLDGTGVYLPIKNPLEDDATADSC